MSDIEETYSREEIIDWIKDSGGVRDLKTNPEMLGFQAIRAEGAPIVIGELIQKGWTEEDIISFCQSRESLNNHYDEMHRFHNPDCEECKIEDGEPLLSIKHPGGDTDEDISDESTEQIEYDSSEVKINTIIHMIDPYHPRRFVHKSATEAPSEFNRDQLERIISVCKRLIYNR